ncbi:hypothetical protein [Nocardiopsis sp. YSL2]|uniref:hypothetical protein n=1 Tax=Nocardiopsis sp. YSL2 TaxID=2939492 RepID=UPI0026F459FF|nr:hypothetical protein [Nocardiopsis sp. YSL2]
MAELAGSIPADALGAVLPSVLYTTTFAFVAVADRKKKQGKKSRFGRFADWMVMLVEKTNTLTDGIEKLLGNGFPLPHFFRR